MKTYKILTFALLAAGLTLVSCKDDDELDDNIITVSQVQIESYENADETMKDSEFSRLCKDGFKTYELDNQNQIAQTLDWTYSADVWKSSVKPECVAGNTAYAVTPALKPEAGRIKFQTGINNMVSEKISINRKGNATPVDIKFLHKMCIVGYTVKLTDGTQASSELIAKINVSLSQYAEMDYDIIQNKPVAYIGMTTIPMHSPVYVIPNADAPYTFTTSYIDNFGRTQSTDKQLEAGTFKANKRYTVELTVDTVNDNPIQITDIHVEDWNDVAVDGEMIRK